MRVQVPLWVPEVLATVKGTSSEERYQFRKDIGSVLKRRITKQKLGKHVRRLAKLREQLSLLEEELVFFNEEAESCRVRALTSDNPSVHRSSDQMLRHVYRLRSRRQKVLKKIISIEKKQDALLDQLAG